MLIFCRCCQFLSSEGQSFKCSKLEIPKSPETVEAYQSCTEFEYCYRSEGKICD